MRRYNPTRKKKPTEGLRTHKVRIYPDRDQRHLLSRHCGYRRVAFNWAVAMWLHCMAVGEWANEQNLKEMFNSVKDRDFPWCRELSQNAAKNGIIDAAQAIENFRKKPDPGKRRAGKPRFAKRTGKPRYQADNGPDTVAAKNKKLRLPKIPGWVRMAEELRFTGEIVSCHISREGDNKWFASMLVRTDKTNKPKRVNGPVIGIDMGVSVLATVTNLFHQIPHQVVNPRAWYAIERRIRYLNKKLARSRNQHGTANRSARREKTLASLREAHHKARCVRLDIMHKATTAIAKSAAIVVLETLNIAGMKANSRLAKAVSDAAMGEFISMLEYKCERYGAKLVRIDRWYPSSQMCARGCGNRQKMALDTRTYRCQTCGFITDRDSNAAINIAAQGIAESCFASDITAEKVKQEIARGGVQDLADLLDRLGSADETPGKAEIAAETGK